eukprot:365176-Chlamydomonas_euryale.AAC.8
MGGNRHRRSTKLLVRLPLHVPKVLVVPCYIPCVIAPPPRCNSLSPGPSAAPPPGTSHLSALRRACMLAERSGVWGAAAVSRAAQQPPCRLFRWRGCLEPCHSSAHVNGRTGLGKGRLLRASYTPEICRAASE